jgi:hypothetical protein
MGHDSDRCFELPGRAVFSDGRLYALRLPNPLRGFVLPVPILPQREAMAAARPTGA